MTTDVVIDREGRRREMRADEILEDGEILRVGIAMMDGTQTRVVDGLGRPAGHGPGFCYLSGVEGDLAAARRQVGRDEYLQRMADAWRGPGHKTHDHEISGDEARDEYLNRLRNAWRGAR